MDLDPALLTWIFFLGGLGLMLLETILPGGVAFFLGAGGLIVAALQVIGLLTDPITAIVAWAFLSSGLTVALRPIAIRYFGGATSIGLTDEDAEAMGQTVTVVELVGEETTGRIRFRGATWDARTIEGRLPQGAEARILYRDNLTWIVEPTDHSALDQELADALGSESLDDRTPSSKETPPDETPSTETSNETSSNNTPPEQRRQRS